MDHAVAIYVVPVTADGDIILLRQYRYPIRGWCWEVPTGGIELEEDGTAAAAPELAEELGVTSSHIGR